MNFIESKGIIFRVVKYSETSVICDIFTRAYGLGSYIMSGVRTSKPGGKAAIFKPMNLINLVAYASHQDNLSRIREVSPSYHYQNINYNIVLSSMAIFALEICRNAIREKESNKELYDYIESWFIHTDEQSEFNPDAHIIFMAGLSHYLGFAPMDNYSPNTPCFNLTEGVYMSESTQNIHLLDEETSRLFYQICKSSHAESEKSNMSRAQRNLLTEVWLKYYTCHIHGFNTLQSFDILKTIL